MACPYPSDDGLVRVYPADEPRGTGMVWMHGGGFAYGDIDMPEADGVARMLASSGFPVVSVDYRLAPPFRREDSPVIDGARFPAASDDVLRAWDWTLAHASEIGLDPSRLALGGASAGGNLAAGAVFRLLQAGHPNPPALVVLAYPTLLAIQPAPDGVLRAALDAQPGADTFGPSAVRAMYENYLGGSVENAPLAAVPGTATIEDVEQYPAVLMINGEVDELRVSGEVFAATLRRAGREVEIVVEPGTTHGHLNRLDKAAAAASLERIARRLSRVTE